MKKFIQKIFRHPRMRLPRKLIRPYFASGSGSEQWMRIKMDQATSELVAALDPSSLKTLEISGKDWCGATASANFDRLIFPNLISAAKLWMSHSI